MCAMRPSVYPLDITRSLSDIGQKHTHTYLKKKNVKHLHHIPAYLTVARGAKLRCIDPPLFFLFRDNQGTFQTLKRRGRRKRGSRRGAEIQTKPSNLNPA